MAKEEKPITFREKLTVRLLLLACQIVSGKSFDGGLPSEINEAFAEIRQTL